MEQSFEHYVTRIQRRIQKQDTELPKPGDPELNAVLSPPQSGVDVPSGAPLHLVTPP